MVRQAEWLLRGQEGIPTLWGMARGPGKPLAVPNPCHLEAHQLRLTQIGQGCAAQKAPGVT